jgi:hypothetical protein
MFFVVLPVGQFVPFLAWIESFEFECVDKLFQFLQLHTKGSDDVSTFREFEEAGGDLLYDYIQKKFYSHGGFLVEALAEAIPQSILQTIAVLYFGEPSALFIISIFVSICVISSKGYLISYSMHRPTFVFNFICIFADVLCMFATICWLFNYDDDGKDGEDESNDNDLFDIHDPIKTTWMCLFCGAAVLMFVSSGSFMVFVTMDKHHEFDVGASRNTRSTLVTYIELYLAHFLSWFFSLIPLAVSLMTFKFIFFPISIQNQDQCNDFAKYKTFYSALHKFVSTNKSDLKLHITNKFLLCKLDFYTVVFHILYYYSCRAIFIIMYHVSCNASCMYTLCSYLYVCGSNLISYVCCRADCKGSQHRLTTAMHGKYGPARRQAVHEWLKTICESV